MNSTPQNKNARREPGAQTKQPGHSSVSPIDILLGRLDRVKQTGPGRYIAKCSAHDDRSPSLTVRETDDGRILLHCFGGCETSDVLAAIGLEFSDLFPEKRIGNNVKRERPPFPASDVIKCLAFEATVLLMAAAKLATGEMLNQSDHDRLLLCVSRIHNAERVCHAR